MDWDEERRNGFQWLAGRTHSAGWPLGAVGEATTTAMVAEDILLPQSAVRPRGCLPCCDGMGCVDGGRDVMDGWMDGYFMMMGMMMVRWRVSDGGVR